MSLGKAEYYEFLRKMEFNPASYKEIANSLMQNGVNEMYHALVNEKDIQTLFTIPNLKIFWCNQFIHFNYFYFFIYFNCFDYFNS